MREESKRREKDMWRKRGKEEVFKEKGKERERYRVRGMEEEKEGKKK